MYMANCDSLECLLYICNSCVRWENVGEMREEGGGDWEGGEVEGGEGYQG